MSWEESVWSLGILDLNPDSQNSRAGLLPPLKINEKGQEVSRFKVKSQQAAAVAILPPQRADTQVHGSHPAYRLFWSHSRSLPEAARDGQGTWQPAITGEAGDA